MEKKISTELVTTPDETASHLSQWAKDWAGARLRGRADQGEEEFLLEAGRALLQRLLIKVPVSKPKETT